MKWLKNSISPVVRALTLTLFLGYSASVMLFYHTHEVRGVLITHSHPYKNPWKSGSEKNHSHSDQQYILLHALFQTSFTDSVIPDIPDGVYANSSDIQTSYTESFSFTITPAESPRAPPSFPVA
ncbi:MAG: hypothetical protein GX622_13740 [Bacteroidales bacterium]|nr:hypothetical protein [Bacteroidales bacterium]